MQKPFSRQEGMEALSQSRKPTELRWHKTWASSACCACASVSLFTETLSRGQDSNLRISMWKLVGSTALILMHRFESCRLSASPVSTSSLGLLHLAEFPGVCGKRRGVEHFSLADNVRFGLGLGVKSRRHPPDFRHPHAMASCSEQK
jgi:hypothetical protein